MTTCFGLHRPPAGHHYKNFQKKAKYSAIIIHTCVTRVITVENYMKYIKLSNICSDVIEEEREQ
jgi:hypothetical protein